LLLLSAVWLGTAGWQCAPAWPAEGFPDGVDPFAGEPVWVEDASDAVLRRLPPPEDLTLIEEPQPLANRRDLGHPGEGDRAPFTARTFWIPTQNVQGQPGNLAVNGEEIQLGFPIRIDTDGIWLALSNVGRVELAGSPVLPDSKLPLPDQLWDIDVGMMHIRQLDDGWRAGGMVRVGSPSDQPFSALRDMTVTLLGFLTVPSGERNAWNFSLFYSPTGQIVFPIPGVAYSWRPNDQFRANIGIPFSLEYRPTETLTLSASYRPLTNVELLLRQALGEFWSIYGGYRTVNRTFLLADRVNTDERMYVFDQRLTLGLQRNLGHRWSVDVSTAYVFDRQIFQAEKFTGSRRDELAIEPGIAGTLQFSWTR
jgi:hypothetical protein